VINAILSFLLNVTECYPDDDLLRSRYVKVKAIPVQAYLGPEGSRSYK
jgi:hypothetical protein